MNVNTSFQTKHANIVYQPDKNILYLTWHNFTPSPEYRNILNKALEIMDAYYVKKWIFDQREAGVIAPDDIKWVVNDWTPRVVQKLGKNIYSAVILAKNIFGEVSLKNLVAGTQKQKDTQGAIETRYFDTVEEAEKWLQSVT
ncbi:MAG: hypothetical protein NZ551_04990 [Microscillaceae bacterium]|nr:hypothetical protein [Microscillaceae bacterium]MDW8460550.1 hypothetical protein [Cytophagales bacterium]